MLVVRGADDVPAAARGAVIAIGNFDGVHRGHQALISRVRELARTLGAPAGVMVFEPHPREFFKADEPHFHLTPLPLKLACFAELGLDLAVVATFDKAFSALSAADFIERTLVDRLGPRHVVIGYDFFFGKGRSGTPDTMREAGARLGFGVSVIAPVAEDGEVFSSTAIRLKLAQGDIRGATSALGRPWRVVGTVTGGAKRGTGLGFPTANITLEPGTSLAHGIYAVWAEVDGERHMAAAYLGTRPTFDNGAPVLEVFLLDFDGDLYGRELSVVFIDHLRADRRFDSIEALKAQMSIDCDAARTVLRADTAATGCAG